MNEAANPPQHELPQNDLTQNDLTLDSYFGGRLQLAQPRKGYRAAIDPILLASCVPARPGDHILEPGIGTGAASLTLLARCAGLTITGIEREAPIAQLARDNAARNGFAAQLRVFEADITSPRLLTGESFQHVMINPPYHDTAHHRLPPAIDASTGALKARATHGTSADITAWLGFGARRLAPGGSLSLIHRADQLAQILAALPASLGAVRVLPIAPRADAPATRILVQALKGRKTPLALLSPLVLHEENGQLTSLADDILRGLSLLKL